MSNELWKRNIGSILFIMVTMYMIVNTDLDCVQNRKKFLIFYISCGLIKMVVTSDCIFLKEFFV